MMHRDPNPSSYGRPVTDNDIPQQVRNIKDFFLEMISKTEKRENV